MGVTHFLRSDVHFGRNEHGRDVKFFGNTDGCCMLWDASEDGLTFAGVKTSQGLASPYFGIGKSGSPIDVTLTDHVVGYEAWLRVANSIAKSLIGGYFKVETDGSNEATLGQLVAVAPRVTVDMALDSAYGVQSHMTISGTKASSELISVSAYVNLGSGARTADRVVALQAMFDGSGTAGTVVGDAIVAYLVNGGTVITTDDILKLFNQSAATVVDMMELENDGTATNMIRLNNDGATMSGIMFEGAFATLIEGTSALTAADQAVHYTVSDTGTHTSSVRGIHVQMTKASGVISGAGSFSGIASDIQVIGNTSNAYAINAYTGISGTPTIGYMSAYRCYCDNLGAAAGNVAVYSCMDLNIDSTNEASASVIGNSFIRMYAHGGPPTSAFYFPSSVGIDNLILFEQWVAPLSAGSGHTTNSVARIAVLVGTSTRYIHLYSD